MTRFLTIYTLPNFDYFTCNLDLLNLPNKQQRVKRPNNLSMTEQRQEI